MRYRFLTLIYLSQAITDPDEGLISRCEEETRMHCESREITGVLVTVGNHFVRIIEGRHADVHAVVSLRARARTREQGNAYAQSLPVVAEQPFGLAC